MTSQINKYTLSCLWFDVGRMLFSNVPFVFVVGFLHPPNSNLFERQMLHAFSNLLCTCMFANRDCDFKTPEIFNLPKHGPDMTLCFASCKNIHGKKSFVYNIVPTNFDGMPPILCMFWFQYSLGCHDSKKGFLFVDATFRQEMNASHELTPPVSFILSSPKFAHWMVFVCFVWAVALIEPGTINVLSVYVLG